MTSTSVEARPILIKSIKMAREDPMRHYLEMTEMYMHQFKTSFMNSHTVLTWLIWLTGKALMLHVSAKEHLWAQ